jgi:ADP-ribose pyrophosphatase
MNVPDKISHRGLKFADEVDLMDGKADKHKYEETTIASNPIFQGRVISVQVDRVRLPDGRTAERELVKHPGAVAVLALLDGRILVVRQYRKPLERTLIEIPAGKLDAGEEPAAAAARELEEETGWKPKRLTHLTSFYTSPGFADEIIHLYFTNELERGDAGLDEDEFLDVFSLSLDEAWDAVADGRIRDAKTITAVYAWQNYVRTGRLMRG